MQPGAVHTIDGDFDRDGHHYLYVCWQESFWFTNTETGEAYLDTSAVVFTHYNVVISGCEIDIKPADDPAKKCTPKNPGCPCKGVSAARGAPAGQSGGGFPGKPASRAGAATSDPVNLWSGAEEFIPPDDFSVYAPSFGRLDFRRQWTTNLALEQYGSPGLPKGWIHNWDLIVVPTGQVGTWHNLELVYPNGAGDALSVELDGQGQPTGNLLPPVGSNYVATGTPSSTVGEWDTLTITFADQTTWTFTPHPAGAYAIHHLGNRLGNQIEFAFDEWGRLLTLTDVTADLVVMELAYDDDGYLDNVADPVTGRMVCYTMAEYEGGLKALAEVSQIVPVDEDEPAMRAQYTYDEEPTLSGGGTDYHYGYWGPDHGHDLDDQLLLLETITVPSPSGTGTATATLLYYDETYRLAEMDDANGVRTLYQYDSGSTTVYVISPDEEVTEQWDTAYNTAGNETSCTRGGCPTAIAYDDPNNPNLPTSYTAPDGRVTTYTYDSYGNVLTITDPRNVVTTNTYDYTNFALGRLVSMQRTADSVTRTMAAYTYYEPSGLVHTVTTLQPGTTDGSTVTTTYTYDDLGNVLTVVAPGNDATSTITTTYNYGEEPKLGQPLIVTDNLDHSTAFTYDDRGNRTSVTDALEHTWTTLYNLANQVTESWQPATGQQGSGNVRVVTEYAWVGGPAINSTVYDEGGNVVQHINTHLGLEGETLAVTGGTEELHYTYDARYRMLTLTDGNDNATSFSYDSKGRLAQIKYPLADEETGYDLVNFTLYDDAGRLLTRVDGKDVTTEYTYAEAGGNLTLIHYPASSTLDVTFGYDALGRRTSMSNNEAAQTYSFDDLGNLLSQSVTYGSLDEQTLSYTYHPNGSRNTFTTPGGTQTCHYDEAGRMTSLVYGLGTAAWEYLDNGLLSKQTLPNGAYTDYAYNVANQLTGLANKAPDDSQISTYGTMTYRGTGDLSTVTSVIPDASTLAGVVDYAYDLKRELTGEDSTRHGGYDYASVFDGAGNATTFRNGTGRTYNADNQLTGPESYVYDGNGNPTTWQGTALSWDPENRMLAYGNILTAGYRGDGLRAWKQTSGGRTYFLYDGINIVGELDGDGDLVAESVFGAAGLLSRAEVQYQFDPLGDAVHQLDGDGAVTANRLFDAWGNELTSSTGPHGYRAKYGYYADAETGLVALAYRYYAPGVGLFLNRDPLRFIAGPSLYGYVAARPTSWVDPHGLCLVCVAIVVVVVVGVVVVVSSGHDVVDLPTMNEQLGNVAPDMKSDPQVPSSPSSNPWVPGDEAMPHDISDNKEVPSNWNDEERPCRGLHN